MLEDAGAEDVQQSKRSRVQTRSAGFIIVAVLWILGALATLAVIYSLYVRETALEFVDHDERLQAQALETAAVELAAYRLTANSGAQPLPNPGAQPLPNPGAQPQPNPGAQPLQGHFDFEQGTAMIGVDFRSENSRIDLNFAPREMLAGLFNGLGVQGDDAFNYADRIVAWRTPLKSGESDSDAALYQAAGKNYGPRHAPFQHPDELALVADIPPSLIDRILPYVTVYTGRPEVNLLVAPPQVLAALPGMTPERLQLLLTLRQVSSPQELTAQLGALSPNMTVEGSKANRVQVEIRFRSGRRMHAQAVILLSDADTEPYRVLSWSDNTSISGRFDMGME